MGREKLCTSICATKDALPGSLVGIVCVGGGGRKKR